MIRFLIRCFVPNADQTNDPTVRERYAVLSGVLGIVCNLLLFFVKLFIGLAMNSIAIISDAFNNFADMGSSLVSLIGAKLSNKRPDKEHPFGHGRSEYVATLIVAFLIMAVGLQLLQSAFDKLINPEPLVFSLPLLLILTASILIKLWMFFYNRYMGKKTNSAVLLATAKDSINDVVSTGAVVLSTAFSLVVPFPLDGIIGILVSLFILYGGFDIVRQTVGLLLGSRPSDELVDQLKALVLSQERILGIHDLVVHDYGPGRVMASLHAEVSDEENIKVIHEVIDSTEDLIRETLGIEAVIHMDPISCNCEKTNHYYQTVRDALSQIDPRLSFHDFRTTDGESRINLIFDLVVPYGLTDKQTATILQQLHDVIKASDSRCFLAVRIDYDHC